MEEMLCRFAEDTLRKTPWPGSSVRVRLLLVAITSIALIWPVGAFVSAQSLVDERAPDDFRISWMGPNGDPAYGAFWFLVPDMTPAAAYNPVDDEYLVVWYADDNTSPLVDEEFEIFGQRVDANSGALLGSRVRISFMGPDGDPEYDALLPAVTYNSIDNEYLVIWVADHNAVPLINDHFEIFGRRVGNDGQLLGVQSQFSAMGPSNDPAYGASWWVRPDIAYNAIDNVYLIVWCGDTNQAPKVNDEFEIWGRRFYASLTPVDASQNIISNMGPDGNPAYHASQPAAAWDSTHNNFLVVWQGDDTIYGLVDEEIEIFGQLVPADPTVLFLILSHIQVSLVGGANGNPNFDAYDPDVAYNANSDNYFVTWWGDDNSWSTADDEFEIWGRLVAWDGTLINTQYRVSSMGSSDGNTAFTADSPAVIAAKDNYIVVWRADDDTYGMVDDEFEVFTNLIPADPTVFGLLVNVRLTTMGVDGDTTRGAFAPALAYDSRRDAGLLVWWGDDNISPTVDDEFEIFGQLLGFTYVFADDFESGDTTAWSATAP